MTDSAPAAPAVKTYTEDDVTALMKEKLAAEAKAASLIENVNALIQALEEQSAAKTAALAANAKLVSELELLKKELALMKKKYIENEPASW